jgi:hypothetical protein
MRVTIYTCDRCGATSETLELRRVHIVVDHSTPFGASFWFTIVIACQKALAGNRE